MENIFDKIFGSKSKVVANAIDLLTLPLISQFRYLQFSGQADGTNLVQNFPPTILPGKIIVIKGIKIIPYYSADAIDLSLTDGVTTNNETVRTASRVNRLFDEFYTTNRLTLLINGGRVPMFPSFDIPLAIPPVEEGNIPLDLDIDNIYYKFPEKITDFNIQVNASISENVTTGVNQIPDVKVFIQCYIL